MFTIRFETTRYPPDQLVTLRTNLTAWDHDHGGVYDNGAWRFELDLAVAADGMQFKFMLEQTYWMLGPNLHLHPAEDGVYDLDETIVQFPPISELVVENNQVQRRFFPPSRDAERLFDVIVIGSGLGGGILADQLSDAGLDVLVLEAGSYLFPVHVANLPRQHQPGRFDKHVWSLYDEFVVANYRNADGSTYAGGQAFNLGGRSIFWGGFIPRLSWWELDLWPQELRWYLEGSGYQRAEDLMNRIPVTPSTFHRRIKTLAQQRLTDHNWFDAPMAVQQAPLTLGTIPNGMFSTADLLLESMLTGDPAGNQHLTINLNHPVVEIETAAGSATGVVAHDLITRRYRTFKGRHVVLAAGTIESAKLVKLSNLTDESGLIGVGLTDHPIYYTHFAIPAGTPHYDPAGSAKLMAQHRDAALDRHPYNLLLELGADFNEGRYVDTAILERHRQLRGERMLCELVFLFNAPLVEANRLDLDGPAHAKPRVAMQPSTSADPFLEDIKKVKDDLFTLLGATALPNDNLELKPAKLGGVAHEVGTLRLGTAGQAVVDVDLRFHGYDNLYACDLSVFPSSPAANPSLTLAALAIRLADHLARNP